MDKPRNHKGMGFILALFFMLIKHRYKYMYIEIPHTTSTTLSQELNGYYDGKTTLYKHAHYW
jgi:hypothetical protein